MNIWQVHRPDLALFNHSSYELAVCVRMIPVEQTNRIKIHSFSRAPQQQLFFSLYCSINNAGASVLVLGGPITNILCHVLL